MVMPEPPAEFSPLAMTASMAWRPRNLGTRAATARWRGSPTSSPMNRICTGEDYSTERQLSVVSCQLSLLACIGRYWYLISQPCAPPNAGSATVPPASVSRSLAAQIVHEHDLE